MTLPEHAVCSLMIAELGARQRLGLPGVLLVVAAGIAPDLDTASKLFGDHYFWKLHHALGHSLLSIVAISALTALTGAVVLRLCHFTFLLGWSIVAATVHCLTDSLYWWGIQPFWPFDHRELCFELLEYLDLIVLSIWLTGAVWLYRSTEHRPRTAAMTLCGFTLYVVIRAMLPAPTGWFKLLTGSWMYAAPSGTPVLDWW